MTVYRPCPDGRYQARDPRGAWAPTTPGNMFVALSGLAYLRQQGVRDATIVRVADGAEIACFGCGMTVGERAETEASIEAEPDFARYSERLRDFAELHSQHKAV